VTGWQFMGAHGFAPTFCLIYIASTIRYRYE